MAGLNYREGTPAGDILQYIQRHGSATIKELEAAFDVSATAVREQISHLLAEGLLTATKVRQGAGRPSFRYLLTAKAQALFPKGYDVLINLLLEEILVLDGREKLQLILDRVGKRLAEQYANRTDGYPDGSELRERLTALAAALEKQGMPIAVHELSEGKFVVSEYACPYFDVAQEHSGVCAMEQRMLEHVLGREVTITRRIVEGHHGCQFVIGDKLESDPAATR
ncbi:MAG: TrmB family transcriptional regulator [Herpetosiphonaceae bacterium]|nr:MAG: TrmB family transcriptional regulator [Herpetosiphonaceae bacterium]